MTFRSRKLGSAHEGSTLRAEIRDLEMAFKGNGQEFEAFIHDLIRAVGTTCGIAAHQIDYDHRTHVPDGGRDIVVHGGGQGSSHGFIPNRPSYWSVKAGEDGIKPSQLKKEILQQEKEDHPKVREALLAGKSYVWCAVYPATTDQRDKMREMAKEVAVELKFPAELIEFRWQDAIRTVLNGFPNVIPQHLPDVENRWAGVRLLNEWRREPYLNTPWSDFGSRAALVTRIASHLRGNGAPNLLHIAGLSGIGKSRAVLEACQSDVELQGVFYLQRYQDLTQRVERSLQGANRVYVVIDETSLDVVESLISRFSECVDQVRIVTIGPASRQRVASRREIVVVPEPQTEEEVLTVIQTPGNGLSETVLRSIASLCAHDLRLALMLVRASQQNPELRTVPIIDFDGVWARLMSLYPNEIPDAAAYRRNYQVLTVAIDVGVEGEFREELRSLASYFDRHESDLLVCSNVSINCGLGLRAGRFFESTPHALAIDAFRTLFRNHLRDRLSEFMAALPARLQMKFLERCQECPDSLREEVAALVGGVFLDWLSHTNVSILTSREASRIFQAWAEFDPVRGLDWLRIAIEIASPEQLVALDGEPDGSGGWRGRRQIVWLCQNLACFRENFANCEAVLFRLALHENERIGNNSTAVWQSLFGIVLSHTELPFQDRFPLLLRRLREASPETVRLPLHAALQCLVSEGIGIPVPPRVVGGRIVPEHWLPSTTEEWRILRKSAGEQVIETIGQLSPAQRAIALAELTRQLRQFRNLGLTEMLRGLFRDEWLTPEIRLSLVLELQRSIDIYRSAEQKEGQPIHPGVLAQETWLLTLAPKDLATRVQDSTARAQHELWDGGDPYSFYAPIADELIASPETFLSLAQWFDSPLAISVEYLGFSIGKRDQRGTLSDIISVWLREDQCRKVTISYLDGSVAKEAELSNRWAVELDEVEKSLPEVTIIATLAADISVRGYKRVMRAVEKMTNSPARLLRGFANNRWSRVLTLEQQEAILLCLVKLSKGSDADAPFVGMELVHLWCHISKKSLDSHLVPSVIELAAIAPNYAEVRNEYDWYDTLRLLRTYDPVRVAKIALEVMTFPGSHPWRFNEQNEILVAECAALDPIQIMETIGQYILDPQRRNIFGISVFRGLFESIGVDAVRQWVNKHGRDKLRWIARHFNSPSRNERGETLLPPLTEWLFTEHEGDQEAFEWFLMGRRHGARIWSGDHSADKQEEMKLYLKHPLRRVREWAEDEIRFFVRENALFQEFEEESERL